jgi:hypothetical protein
MTKPFKISPKTALSGNALATEVRHTYPLSPHDERALRIAVQNILVRRLSRASIRGKKAVRDVDVRQAAAALGVTKEDLQRTLASHGVPLPMSRIGGTGGLRGKRKISSKAKTSRRGKLRRASRTRHRARG